MLITLDFEGTMVDFQYKVGEVESEALRVLVRQGVPQEYFSGMNYAGIYNTVREKEEEWGFPRNSLISLLDEIYDTYDLDAASRWKPVPGLYEMLEQLREHKIAVVSNVGRKALEKILLKFGLLDSFGLIVTRNDVRLLKPAEEGLLKAIAWAQVGRESVIHIGDSLSDLHAARSAGVKVGIVLGGENRPEVLLRENPDLVLNSLADLPSALKNIEK